MTIDIRDRRLTAMEGLDGHADLHVIADSTTWIGFLAKQKSLFWALLTRRVRLRGPIRLLRTVGRCFRS